jgi:adenosyl cobinamide kinase/adenosyl cobinamide phosphate guanylyltransferase
MQFYNKTSFVMLKMLTMYFYFFLESPESGIRFRQKSLPECDSLICCIDTGKTGSNIVINRETGSSIVSSRSSRYFFEFRFVFQHE